MSSIMTHHLWLFPRCVATWTFTQCTSGSRFSLSWLRTVWLFNYDIYCCASARDTESPHSTYARVFTETIHKSVNSLQIWVCGRSVSTSICWNTNTYVLFDTWSTHRASRLIRHAPWFLLTYSSCATSSSRIWDVCYTSPLMTPYCFWPKGTSWWRESCRLDSKKS